MKHLQIKLLNIVSFVKTGPDKAVLLLWPQIKLHLHALNAQPYDILKVKNALIKSVYCTICRAVNIKVVVPRVTTKFMWFKLL